MKNGLSLQRAAAHAIQSSHKLCGTDVNGTKIPLSFGTKASSAKYS